MAATPGQTDAPANSRDPWCAFGKSLERHARSTGGTCEDCDVQDAREFDICGCAYGLMETDFTGTTRQ